VTRKRICIISYSSIKHDPRVLRQIEYLASRYDVTAVGYGDQPNIAGVKWHLSPYHDSLVTKLVRNSLQIMGRVIPAAYDLLEISQERYWKTLRAVAPGTHAVLADDLSALPVAAHLARRTGAKLVFDAHEFSPLEQETPKFRRLETPNRLYLLRKYAKRANASLTVCTPIAERLAQEFGLQPLVIMNAPKYSSAPDHAVDPHRIRLIYQGTFQTYRHQDDMIRVLALTDRRFELHFFLVGSEENLKGLKQLGDELAPGRVFFHPSIPAQEVISRIAEYDLGFFLLPPTNYNNAITLPLKLFDYIMAGLGVVTGPTPPTVQIIQQYKLGCVASSFEPKAVAQLLNTLTVEQINVMRANAREAAHTLNADTEMAKMLTLFDQLLGD